MLLDQVRIRAIVSLAASKVEDPNTKDWLRTDREGSWEKMAREYLESPRVMERASAGGKSDAEVDDQIAAVLAYFALSAQIEHVKKRGQSARRR
jgi:hypothetical protein